MLKRLGDLKVATKLGAGFGAMCLLLAVVVGMGVTRLNGSQNVLRTMSSSGVASVQAVGDARAAQFQIRLDFANLALTPDPAKFAKATEQLNADQAALDAAWAVYKSSSPSSTEADRAAYESTLATYRSKTQRLIELAGAHDTDGFIAYRASEITPVVDELFALLASFRDTEAQAATDIADAGASTNSKARMMLLGVGLVAILLAIGLAVVISRAIARPLAKAVAVVQGMAEGRLDARVDHSSRDEVGTLAAALNTTLEKLGGVIRSIGGNATTLASSSEELTSVATQLSSGAEESSAQAQSVSATSSQISSNIGTVAAAGEQMTAAIREIAASTSEATATAATAVGAAHAAQETLVRLAASSR